MTREELDAANEVIERRLNEATNERERLALEIDTLRAQRLENTKQINRLLRDEIAAQG